MVGESGNFIYTKMQVAALKQVLKWNPEDIQEYCKAIASDTVEELKKMGCAIERPNQRSHHLFGVKVPDGLDLKVLKAALADQQVFVSFRGQYIRVSCHYFNTKEDFKALADCMASVLETA